MFKKIILPAAAALALMVGMQAPASAAMGIANPAVAAAEMAKDTSNIVKVGGRGHRKARGGRFRHRGGFRRHRWGRHHRWGYRHYWRPPYNCYWHYGHKHCGYYY